jgi:SAM-dependent methyltransferase
MPVEEVWSGFFSPEHTLAVLGLSESCRTVVDVGCGYGTFCLPAARIVRGTVHALDIDDEMITAVMAKAEAEQLSNLVATQRDIESGTGVADATADYVMLFNILHTEYPQLLLREARRILRPDGLLAVMHWNYGATPRGPSLGIRLRPEQCRELVAEAGFALEPLVELPPHHFGFVAMRRT